MFNFNDYEMGYTLPLEYGIRLVEHDRFFDILEKYFIHGQLINKADHLKFEFNNFGYCFNFIASCTFHALWKLV